MFSSRRWSFPTHRQYLPTSIHATAIDLILRSWGGVQELAVLAPIPISIFVMHTKGTAGMASIFNRVSDILQASIHDTLDKVENPEQMVKQMVREMEQSVTDAKERVIDAVASEKTLQKQLERNQAQADEWRVKAERALETGREDIARSALERKKEHLDIFKKLEPTWKSAKQTSTRLKQQMNALEAKLEEAKRKQTSLVARQKGVEAIDKLGKISADLNSQCDTEATFGRMEDKVSEMEARTEAYAEVHGNATALEDEVKQIETDAEIEAELEALKSRMQQPSAPA